MGMDGFWIAVKMKRRLEITGKWKERQRKRE
jgi:hypothetical protein